MIWVYLGILAAIVAVALLLPSISRRRRARQLGCPLGYLQLLGMGLRGANVDALLKAKAQLKDEGIDVPLRALEVHQLAKRKLEPVINGMIEARRQKVELTWEMACAMDMMGRDIQADLFAAKEPKEVLTPKIKARTVDGGEVTAQLKVKLRFVPERAVGAGDETFVIERICAAAEADIARSESCDYLTQRPATFARRIFERRLDAGSAFKIEWIDVEEMQAGKVQGA